MIAIAGVKADKPPAPLLALRKILRKQALLADEDSLLQLLYACTDRILRSTKCGADAKELFKHVGLPVPKPSCELAIDNSEFDESSFGYIYQLFRQPKRTASQSRVAAPNKETRVEDMVAFTQLFTPDWVVAFLLEQTLPDEKRAHATVIDPACGTGHFLLQAVDVIFNARKRFESPSAAMQNALSQVVGCDIDDLSLKICKLAMSLKALRHLQLDELPDIQLSNVLETNIAPLGSLDRGWNSSHILNRRYDAVVGNPPYLGRKLLSRDLKAKLKQEYPRSHQDLAAAFVERGLELLKPAGRLGYITQSSLLYLPSYGALRNWIIDNYHLDTVIEAGTHVFPLQTGEKVNSVLLVLSAEPAQSRFLDLTGEKNKQEKLECAVRDGAFLVREQSDFRAFRGTAFNYSCPSVLSRISNEAEHLSEQVDIRQGLATTDNARFLRWWWQVPPDEIGKRWIPYAKGGGSQRWYAPIDTVVDWGNNGEAIKETVARNYPYLNGKTEWVVKNEQFYFKEGLTFSFIGSGNLSVRWLPPGCIFDVGGSAMFCEEDARLFLLAYLNSSFIATCARLLNPTINFQVGDLKQLPMFKFAVQEMQALSALAQSCIQNKRWLCSLLETSREIFPAPELFTLAPQQLHRMISDRCAQLAEAEAEIDELVLQAIIKAHRLSGADGVALRAACSAAAATRKAQERPIENDAALARVLVSAALFADWNRLSAGTLAISPIEASALANRVARNLGPERVAWLEKIVSEPLTAYLSGRFLLEHTRIHHGFPRLVL